VCERPAVACVRREEPEPRLGHGLFDAVVCSTPMRMCGLSLLRGGFRNIKSRLNKVGYAGAPL
jgi:hypothetical protein